MATQAREVFEFGAFRFDPGDHLLFRDGKVVPLTPKAADTLHVLISRAGHVVDREELLKLVWPDTFVEESSLTRNISQLRKALGEDECDPYIETIPKRGYRFVADVRQVTFPAQPVASEPGATSAAAVRRLGPAMFVIAACVIGIALGVSRFTSLFDRTPRPEEIPFTTLPGGEYEPAFSPDGNTIAFVWNGPSERHYGIYTKSVGGGDTVQVVADASDEGSPAWSRDGRSIAFVRYSTADTSGIYIIRLQDRVERKVGTLFPVVNIYDRKLDWSPDGNTMAVVDKDSAEEPLRIDIVHAGTGERRHLTTPPAKSAGDTSPVFSPDGKRVAFKRNTGSGVNDIYVVGSSGGEAQRFTADNRYIAALDWTEDGSGIVFASDRQGGRRLWLVSASGGTPKPIEGAAMGARYLAVARKGNRLAYSYWFADTNIWRVEASKASQPNAAEKLISSTRAETSAQYSPDGAKIAFRSDQSGATEIWVADSSGKNSTRLTSFNGPLTGSPRWSPDGRYLAFDSRPEGTSNIYLIPSGGGTPKRVTSGVGDNVLPSWSRDGKWIYFASTRSGSWEVWKIASNASGAPVQVTHSGGFAAFESLDGKILYYAKGLNTPGLWMVPTSGGGEELLLPDLKAGWWGCWSVASGGIYYLDPEAKSDGANVLLFDPGTRRSTTIGRIAKKPPFSDSGFSVSPDGRWFLFTQTDHSGSDIMLVQNFR